MPVFETRAAKLRRPRRFSPAIALTRHFCASQNEKETGQSLEQAVKDNGISPDTVFVTTKGVFL